MKSDILNEIDIQINIYIKSFVEYIEKINIGRISPNLLNKIKIKHLNKNIFLDKVSNISLENSKTLIIQPFDKNLIEIIKKGIINFDSDLNVFVHNFCIKVIAYSITEEKRIKIIKTIKSNSEKVKISIRNLRRDFNEKVKNLKKNKEINEDDFHKYNKKILDLTNKYIKYIDTLLENKNKKLIKI